MRGPIAPLAPVADLDRRFYAFAIDRAIAWSIDAAAAVVLFQVLIDPGHLWAGIAAITAVVVVVGGVFAVVVGLTGTSPGMAVGALRVVREGSGTPIGVGAALLRQLILGVAALPTLGLGIATLAWTAVMDPAGRRRGWHDHVSHAVVVDVRPLPEELPEEDAGPRSIVNLTALRLVPAPARTPATAPARATRPSAPPPVGPPVAVPAVTATASPTPVPDPAPVPVPVPAAAPTLRHAGVATAPAPAPAGPARQQLGYPLVPEPRPDAAPTKASGGGSHAARTEPVRWRVSFDSGESFLVEGLALVGRRPAARNGEPVRHLVELPVRRHVAVQDPRAVPGRERRCPRRDGPRLDQRLVPGPSGCPAGPAGRQGRDARARRPRPVRRPGDDGRPGGLDCPS